MPKGDNLTTEHQKAAARKHGVYSMKSNSITEWAASDRELALQVAEELETRGLSELHVRLAAGKAHAMLEALTGYIITQLNKDVPVEELPSFNQWPKFFNSYLRALKMAHALVKDNGVEPTNVTEALENLTIE